MAPLKPYNRQCELRQSDKRWYFGPTRWTFPPAWVARVMQWGGLGLALGMLNNGCTGGGVDRFWLAGIVLVATFHLNIAPASSCSICYRVIVAGGLWQWTGKRRLFLCQKHGDEYAAAFVASGVDASNPDATQEHARAWLEARHAR